MDRFYARGDKIAPPTAIQLQLLLRVSFFRVWYGTKYSSTGTEISHFTISQLIRSHLKFLNIYIYWLIMGRNIRHRNGKGQASGVAVNAAGGNGTNGGATTTMSADSTRQTALSAALKHHQEIKSRIDQRTKYSSRMRTIILALLCVYFITKNMQQYFFPHGTAVVTLPTYHAAVDTSNDLLRFHHNKTQKIVTNGDDFIKGPETIVFGNDGTMYVLSEDAYLLKVDPFHETPDGRYINSTVTMVADLGTGRPLGGKFTPKGNTLYICDAVLGLIRVRDVKDLRKSKIEIVTRTAMDSNGTMSPIEYADDVVIGPKTGKVYFTDATDIAPQRKHSNDVWDTLFASKLDVVRGKAAGRLLQYDPSTDRTTILATDLKFPNGIGIDKDETYLVFAETFGVNLWKYHLINGTMELLIGSQDLPGYLDGVDCSWTTGLCYSVMPSAIVPMHHFLNHLPIQASQIVRNILLLLPKWLAPPVKKFGGVVEVDPNTKVFRLLLDPKGKDISMITGVTVHKNKLYLGSLLNKYIGVYNLQ